MARASATQSGEPWRQGLPWNKETFEKLRDDVRGIIPPPPPACDVEHLNILLLGQIGAGKSSFFNTVSSTFQGHLSGQARSGSAEASVTSKLTAYKVRDGVSQRILRLRLCDYRGLEDGVDTENEIRCILEGHFGTGYESGSVEVRARPSWYRLDAHLKRLAWWIGTRTPYISPYFTQPAMPHWRESPTMGEKMHCVCFTVDGSSLDVMTETMAAKLKRLQGICDEKGITYVVVLTKVDVVCGDHVKQNVSRVFHSSKVHTVVKDVIDNIFTGIPELCVLPVKNYANEADVRDDVSILALLALKVMLGQALDFLWNKCDNNQMNGEVKETHVIYMPKDA